MIKLLIEFLINALTGRKGAKVPSPTEDPQSPPMARPRAVGVDIPTFVAWKGETEGLKDHTASEGQFTYAYGILPATANGLGISRSLHKTSKSFAEAVYKAMLDQMKVRYPEIDIDKMEREVAHAVFSFYINLGSFGGGTRLHLARGDVAGAFLHNLKVVTYSHRKTGVRYFSKGLAARRAKEYNAVAPVVGLQEIRKVVLSGTKVHPRAQYIGSDGKSVYVYESAYPLSPDNSMTPVMI
jgi:hypothetical protein